MMGNSAPTPQAPKGPALTLANLPKHVLDELRHRCKLNDHEITEVLEAVQQGARTPAEMLGITPAAFNTLESMALTFYRHRHYPHAASFYGFLLELDIKRASAWRGLGACNQALKVYPVALYCYENALELTPNDVVTQVLLGETLCLLGRPDYGLQVLQGALDSGSTAQAHQQFLKRAQAIVQAHAAHHTPTEEPTQAAPAPEASSEPVKHLSVPLDEATVQRLTAQFTKGGDDRAVFDDPQMKQLVATLAHGVYKERITLKDVAGFTDEQMYGGYVAACQYLDLGQPLMSMHIIGWLIHIDSRNASYYQLAGLCAQHLKLWCFADYLYGLSLIYDKNNPNPITMIYRGEAKLFSEERHAGLALLRDGLARCSNDPDQQDAAKRAKALLAQFGTQTDRSANRPSP